MKAIFLLLSALVSQAPSTAEPSPEAVPTPAPAAAAPAKVAAKIEAPPGPAWQEIDKQDGITLYKRERTDSALHEYQASGMFDVPIDVLWEALVDFDHFKMIYAEKTEILKRSEKEIYIYVLTSPPLLSKRDYTLHYTQYIDEGPEGVRVLRWAASNAGPPPVNGVVRLNKYDGFWKLEPRENGKKTFATTFSSAEAGGSVPLWIVNNLAGPGLMSAFKGTREKAMTRYQEVLKNKGKSM